MINRLTSLTNKKPIHLKSIIICNSNLNLILHKELKKYLNINFYSKAYIHNNFYNCKIRIN